MANEEDKIKYDIDFYLKLSGIFASIFVGLIILSFTMRADPDIYREFIDIITAGYFIFLFSTLTTLGISIYLKVWKLE